MVMVDELKKSLTTWTIYVVGYGCDKDQACIASKGSSAWGPLEVITALERY